ncbi:lytic transglycosylase domain-containing protein [Bradyrhizobium sp. S69]|uniref:lytic transglycosylase domain-containing protein n=1 Tax=Bradyrhizobium sp. S69 TaxID=1641856 RepID=UPI001FEE1F10|nr:lytic transglycosylase domain-containing protein [Bradyrhizobium sp. S69]
MIALTQEFAISLFDRIQRHSSVPTNFATAVARSGGQGRPLGRRDSASTWMAGSTTARLRSLGTMVCIVAISALPMLSGRAAHAERLSPTNQQRAAVPANPFAGFVTEASKRFAVPEHWIRAVMRVESGGKIHARSRKGAMGLTQIMPETWKELRARYGLGTDPYDPRDNILAGAAYIRELYDRYGAPGFLAAYNAGPGRYEIHLATGRPLPGETQDYIAMLAPIIGGKQANGKIAAAADTPTLAQSPLFVVGSASSSSNDRHTSGVRPDLASNVRPVVDLSALVPQPGNLFVHHAGEARSQ